MQAGFVFTAVDEDDPKDFVARTFRPAMSVRAVADFFGKHGFSNVGAECPGSAHSLSRLRARGTDDMWLVWFYASGTAENVSQAVANALAESGLDAQFVDTDSLFAPDKYALRLITFYVPSYEIKEGVAESIVGALLEGVVGLSRAEVDGIINALREIGRTSRTVSDFTQRAEGDLAPHRITFTRPKDCPASVPGAANEDGIYLQPPPSVDPRVLDQYFRSISRVLYHELIHAEQMKRSTNPEEMAKSGQRMSLDGRGNIDMDGYRRQKQEIMAFAGTLVDDWKSQGLAKSEMVRRLNAGDWRTPVGHSILKFQHPKLYNLFLRYARAYVDRDAPPVAEADAALASKKSEIKILPSKGLDHHHDILIVSDKAPVYIGTIAPRQDGWAPVKNAPNVGRGMRAHLHWKAPTKEEAAVRMAAVMRPYWKPIIGYHDALSVFEDDDDIDPKEFLAAHDIQNDYPRGTSPFVYVVRQDDWQGLNPKGAVLAIFADKRKAHNYANNTDAHVFKAPRRGNAVRAWHATGQSIAETLLDDVEAAAAETDPNPSDGQKEAGNYAKGKVSIDGIEITIENAAGSKRSGKDKDGKAWEVTIPAPYGYISRVGGETAALGKDGDKLDVYIGEHPSSMIVYVINQNKIDSKAFDEVKIMLGFKTKEEAIATYDKAFTGDLGPKLRASVVSTTVDKLKAWIKSGDTKKPFESLAESVADALLDDTDDPKDFAQSRLRHLYVVRNRRRADKKRTVLCVFSNELHAVRFAQLTGAHVSPATSSDDPAVQAWLAAGNHIAEAVSEALPDDEGDPKDVVMNIPPNPTHYGQLKVGAVVYTENGSYERVEEKVAGYGKPYQDASGRLVYDSGYTTLVQLTEFSPCYAYGYFKNRVTYNGKAALIGCEVVDVADNSDEALWKLVDQGMIANGRTAEEIQAMRDRHQARMGHRI